MTIPVLADRCVRLGLPEVARLAQARAETAAASQQPYPAYLADRLQAEADSRPQRDVTSRVQMAPWPFRKTLEAFDFRFPPRIDERQIRTLAALQWVDGAANLLWLGPPGVGKTPWLVALALTAIPARYSVSCVTVQDLVADLRQARDENRFAKRLAIDTRPQLLGVDAMGYLPMDRHEATRFFRLVAARYETGRMALTANQGFSEGGARFGDPVLATAIRDRLLHHATRIHMRGESYRLREKQRTGQRAGPPDPFGSAAKAEAP